VSSAVSNRSHLSDDDAADMGAKRATEASLPRLKPSEIWYTFGKVSDRFSGCGRALEETLREIQDGALRVDDLPPIAVVTHDVEIARETRDDSSDDDVDRRKRRSGTRATSKPDVVRRYYSMNNRRLWVLKRCETLGLCEDVGVRMESREACERLLRKGSRNFRVDRCTPGPVKIVETVKREEGATATAAARARD
jgi:hypothetical protein